MKIIYKDGDLLKADERYIMQGCNAQGVMRSGVAKLLRDGDEGIFLDYRRVYEMQGNRLSVGQVLPYLSEKLNKIILNAITQKFYGRDPSVVYVSYEGMRTAMRNVNNVASSGAPVAMPLIGAGLANGDWNIISGIIEDEATSFQPVVYLNGAPVPR